MNFDKTADIIDIIDIFKYFTKLCPHADSKTFSIFLEKLFFSFENTKKID